jgi:chemotaxis protein MotB
MAQKGPDPNSWMVTFSDLIMLLLTFFVLLLTMSSMDTKQLKAMFTHFKESTGILEFSGAQQISGLANFVERYNTPDNILVLDNNLIKNIFLPGEKEDETMGDDLDKLSRLISISDDERGLILSFEDHLLFDSGQVTLRKEVFPFLDSIADAIESCSNEILIMGHTDDIPVRSFQFPSNFELSLHRGLSVLEYLTQVKGVPPERFSVGGYGSSRPKAANDGPKKRALNRRVEIIFRHI